MWSMIFQDIIGILGIISVTKKDLVIILSKMVNQSRSTNLLDMFSSPALVWQKIQEPSTCIYTDAKDLYMDIDAFANHLST